MMFNSAATALLAARGAICARWLFWAQPWRLSDGVQVGIGLWTGPGDQTITVEGQARLYQGDQGGMALRPIVYDTGAVVTTQRVVFGLTPEAEAMMRAHRTRQAPAQIHLAICDPASEVIVDIVRVWRGAIDRAPLSTGGRGGAVTAEVEIASAMRGLTDTLALKKTDASQSLRGGDRFRRYGSVTAATAPAEWIAN